VYSAAAWIVFRIIGYVVVVPLAEELAFRGFLARRIMRADFHNVPIGTFSWLSFLLSSLLFGIFHGKLWLAGTGAGMLFALALYRRRSLGDAIQSHATTNAMLAVYAVVTGNWSAWS
jgi:CAAX prenyl protease-like protein